ncbi:GIY-YIG nuclease family protein [Paenibacillus cellulositrophicus]|nr:MULTISPECIES: GIY-YIG nuclease family protein [Paenibacillus]MCM3000211.1 GIY-YIG nuclease family protein [Paenibacillus cellulositrophicus]
MNRMDKSRRAELIAQYKEMKPQMGVYMLKCVPSGRIYLGFTQDMKSMLNRHQFMLKSGLHKCKELQREWNEYGESQFEVKVVDTLAYDKDESKTDYTEDLELLRDIWKDKLENVEMI